MTDWHSYSHGAQRIANVWLVVLAVAAAYVWGASTRTLDWNPAWWIDTPAVFGFYGLIHWLYARTLWRVKPFRAIHGIPDLRGHYRVSIRTSHDEHTGKLKGAATIAQSWNRIVVRIQTESSTSVSRAAWLMESPGAGFTLTYLYDNAPRSAAAKLLATHTGTAEVTFDSARRGTGTYYTGPGRTSHGEVVFEPKPS